MVIASGSAFMSGDLELTSQLSSSSMVISAPLFISGASGPSRKLSNSMKLYSSVSSQLLFSQLMLSALTELYVSELFFTLVFACFEFIFLFCPCKLL